MLLAVCQEFEMDVDDKIIPRIAFGFAGGFGNTGAVCGAVCGAVMAISLRTKRDGTLEEMLRALGVVGKFRRRFEAEVGSINCRELTGEDLTTPDGMQRFMSSDTPQTVCFPAVGLAYRLAVELLRKPTTVG